MSYSTSPRFLTLECTVLKIRLVGNFFVMDRFMNSDIEGDRVLTSNFSAKLGIFDVVASSAYHIRLPHGFLH